MARSFAERSHETELMDTETVSLDDYRACLKDLATVNAVTLTHRPILQWLDHATRDLKEGERVSVIDVGYGYGDLLRKIHDWSRRRNRTVELIGVDLNPMSEPIARAATPGRHGHRLPDRQRLRFQARTPYRFHHQLADDASHVER